MADTSKFVLFAVCIPGLEKVLIEELRELEFQDLVPIIGGVEFSG
ncbi:MAG: class I SAM-dependent RNA methyltransferase, partial [Paracoccaceae bacterium]